MSLNSATVSGLLNSTLNVLGGTLVVKKDKYSIIEDSTTLNLYVGGSIEKSRADHDMSSARMVCIAEERISMR